MRLQDSRGHHRRVFTPSSGHTASSLSVTVYNVTASSEAPNEGSERYTTPRGLTARPKPWSRRREQRETC